MDRYGIGIYTFWDVPNYGTFVQAYALQRIIDKLMPEDDVRQIAHLNRRHFGFYYSVFPEISIKRKAFYKQFLIRLLKLRERKGRQKLFQSFYRCIKHTKDMNDKELSEASFKTVVLGSDIVWDFSQEVFGQDPFLFGEAFQSDKVISYAASFGVAKAEDAPDYVISGIKNMDAISVRDEKSAAIVEKLTGNRPKVVLDPTWLWDFDQDENIVSPDYGNYLIVYGQNFSDKFIEQTVQYARQNKLKLLCLDCNEDNYNWCDVVIRQSELTPFEWIGYFKNAQAVATSTFHGLTFGLIFNRPLAFCKTEFILAKASSFLDKLGLLELYQSDATTVEEMMQCTSDYTAINQVISAEKEKSISFLIDNLQKG